MEIRVDSLKNTEDRDQRAREVVEGQKLTSPIV
jgi:hypothetical protein